MKDTGNRDYTLVELITVIAIMTVLAAASAKVYEGFMERAETAELYEKARLIRQAMMVYELDCTGGEGWDTDDLSDPAFYKLIVMPNNKSSGIYPYVSDITQDCTKFEVRLTRRPGGKSAVSGFYYETKDYLITYRDPGSIKVTKKSKESGISGRAS